MFSDCKMNDMIIIEAFKSFTLGPTKDYSIKFLFSILHTWWHYRSLQCIVTYEHTSPMELIKILNSRRIQQQNEK
jgi:hypothetical protein